MRENLLGYLLGALDEPEQERIEAQLQRDPQLQADLERLDAVLDALRAGRNSYPPPEGLAEQTCEYVAAEAERLKVTLADKSAATAAGGGLQKTRRWTLADLVVGGGVVAAAALLFFPAIAHSRFQSQVAGCQNNLRLMHVALTQYAGANHGYYPGVPTEGNLAFSGVYAPMLVHGGYVNRPSVFLCAASPKTLEFDRNRFPSLADLKTQSGKALAILQKRAGGNYGYNLGYVANGEYRGIRHRGRSNYAIMADSPSLYLARLQSANHGGCGQNVLFEDGRVQYLVSCQSDCDDIFLSDRQIVEPGRHIDDAVIAHSAAPIQTGLSN